MFLESRARNDHDSSNLVGTWVEMKDDFKALNAATNHSVKIKKGDIGVIIATTLWAYDYTQSNAGAFLAIDFRLINSKIVCPGTCLVDGISLDKVLLIKDENLIRQIQESSEILTLI